MCLASSKQVPTKCLQEFKVMRKPQCGTTLSRVTWKAATYAAANPDGHTGVPVKAYMSTFTTMPLWT